MIFTVLSDWLNNCFITTFISFRFEKDLASHLVRHQHASNVVNETQMPLKKITNELRSQTQQLKDALQLLNKVKRVTSLQNFFN